MYIYVIRMKEMGKDDLDWEFRNWEVQSKTQERKETPV
jgi:hypothetical protein